MRYYVVTKAVRLNGQLLRSGTRLSKNGIIDSKLREFVTEVDRQGKAIDTDDSAGKARTTEPKLSMDSEPTMHGTSHT